MNPAQLLAHFSRISEAPDAIPCLRRFILDLAVRGKLVKQDPKDEPASALLKRIQSEKAGIRKEKLLPPIDAEPYKIPSSWEWTRLGNTGRVFNGNSVSESDKADLSKVIEGYPFIATKDVGYGRDRLAYDNGIRVPFDASGFKVAHAQAVLICSEGGSAGKKVGITERDICFGNKLYANELWRGINPYYILSVYQSSPFFKEFASRMTGIIGGIARSEFLLLPVPIPPANEQSRIVAKVDELIVLCDLLEAVQAGRETRRDGLVAASLKRGDNQADVQSFREDTRFYLRYLPRLTTRPAHIQQLRQTILSLAVRGQLVPQDPSDEPSSELLKRIQAEKTQLMKDGVLRKERPMPPIGGDDAPFAIPPSWSWSRIGTCSLVTEYGTSVKSVNATDGVPVLNMGDIQGGKVVLGGQKRVPRGIDDLPRLLLKRFDLLYNRTNSAELVGKTGIYLGEDDTYTFASYNIRIRFPTHLTNPIFANLAMNAPYFRQTQILPELKQQCGQANVNGTKLRNMLIPLPPLAEQHHIVAKVEELLTLCDRLESQLTTSQTESRRLLEAVLHQALAPAAV